MMWRLQAWLVRSTVFLIIGFSFFPLWAQEPTPDKNTPPKSPPEKQITLDFNNVDLPVLVKFISELTGKNFVIDERVRGKVTIFSPVKIPVNRAYEVFLSVLELKGLAVGRVNLLYKNDPPTTGS